MQATAAVSQVLNTGHLPFSSLDYGPYGLTYGRELNFMTDEAAAAVYTSLALDLLFYDRICIAVGNMSQIARFADWLEYGSAIPLLESGAVQFVVNLAVVGAVKPAVLSPSPNASASSTLVSMSMKDADPEELLGWAIKGQTSWGKVQATRFGTALSPICMFQKPELLDSYIAEAQSDFSRDDIRALAGPPSDLLERLEPDDPRMLGVLRLTDSYVALGTAATGNFSELHGDSISAEIMRARLSPQSSVLQRPSQLVEGLDSFRDVRGLPDVSAAGRNRFAFKDLLNLRERPSGRRFRKWLSEQEHDWTEGKALLREYVDDLNVRPSVTQRLFSIASATGMSALAGALVGAAIAPVEIAAPAAAGHGASLLVDALKGGWRLSAFLNDEITPIFEGVRRRSQ